MATTTVLVTAGTGEIGRHVASKLLKEPNTVVRVATRDPEGKVAQKLTNEGAQVIVLDYNKPETIQKALEGVDKIYWNGNFGPHLVPQCKKLAEEVLKVKDNIKFICKISTVEIGKTTDCIARWHGECEQIVRDLGIPHVMIRPNGFSANLAKLVAHSVRDRAVLETPFEDGKVPWVDTRDIADVCFVTLTQSEKFLNSPPIYVDGPRVLGGDELAASLSQLLGRKIEHKKLNREQFISSINASGSTFMLPQMWDNFFEMLTQVVHPNTCSDIHFTQRELLGREAIPLEQFLQETLSDWQPKQGV